MGLHIKVGCQAILQTKPCTSPNLSRLITPKVPHEKFLRTGLLIFRGKKKAKFRGIFRGKFAEKSADFAGFSRGKSQNLQNNRPILGDFRRRKVKIRRKIGPFRGILAEKSQFSKDFQGQILRKISQFHGKFRGGNFANKQSVKNSRFRWGFFWQISLKLINFASI